MAMTIDCARAARGAALLLVLTAAPAAAQHLNGPGRPPLLCPTASPERTTHGTCTMSSASATC